MGAQDTATWNPVLHLDVIDGPFDGKTLRERTLSFTLTDDARKYDQIEWSLNNDDGLLTNPQFLALGLLLRVRYGYASSASRWRVFVISRLRGGVGVSGKKHPPRDQEFSTITYSGRNRNAPDLRKGKSRKRSYGKRIKPTGAGGQKTNRGEQTGDITQLENTYRKDGLSGSKDIETKIFRVRHLSDAAREIAIKQGYPPGKIFIAKTDDDLNAVIIPENQRYAEFLKYQADHIGWISIMNGKEFRFHPERWKEEKKKIRETFVYGADPNILSLTIDADFRIPVPGKTKAKGVNPLTRRVDTHEEGGALSSLEVVANSERKFNSFYGDIKRNNLSNEEEVFPAPGAITKLAGAKATKRFIDSHLRAFVIRLRIVGNPFVEAKDLIEIKGTGSILVDRIWYAEIVKHIFSGETYVTEIELRQHIAVGAQKTGAVDGREEGSKAIARYEYTGTEKSLDTFYNTQRGSKAQTNYTASKL